MAKSTIDLLAIGCTGQELVDKINEIIAAVNGVTPATSYRDLTEKPTLNGVELVGDATTASLKVRIVDTADYDTYEQAWATKTYVDNADTKTIEAAEASVKAQLDSKMDKDLSSLDEVQWLADTGYMPVVVGGQLKKMSIKDAADYAVTKKEAAYSAADKSIASQRKYMDIEGTQDGSNADFYVKAGYALGTTALYLNGQLLTINKDYTEISSYQIKMLTRMPEKTDILILMAIPL